MEDFLGLGGLFAPQGQQPTGDTQGGSTTEQWAQALKNPTTQAALLTMGVQMMMPRWNPGSAIPDALTAGSQVYAADYADKEAKRVAAESQAFKAGEGAKDRSAALERAKLAANSRAEVANIRAESTAANLQQRLAGKTPDQLKFWQQAYLKAYGAMKASQLVDRTTDEDIQRKSMEAADAAEAGRAAKSGGGGTANQAGKAGNTRQNMGNGPAGPTPAAGNTASPNAAPARQTAADLIARVKANGVTDEELAENLNLQRQLYMRALDPENLPFTVPGVPKRLPQKSGM